MSVAALAPAHEESKRGKYEQIRASRTFTESGNAIL